MATLNYGLVRRAKPGQAVSGDASLVIERENRILIAMADGLGSGVQAQAAAQKAMTCLQQQSHWEVIPLIEECHLALKETRGAALAVLIIDPQKARLECVSVGNVEVRGSQASAIKPIPVNGIVGHRFGSLRRFTCRYTRGELLVVHSDGLSSKFDFDLEVARVGSDPQTLADHLGHHFGRDSDDVTVLVARLP